MNRDGVCIAVPVLAWVCKIQGNHRENSRQIQGKDRGCKGEIQGIHRGNTKKYTYLIICPSLGKGWQYTNNNKKPKYGPSQDFLKHFLNLKD